MSVLQIVLSVILVIGAAVGITLLIQQKKLKTKISYAWWRTRRTWSSQRVPS